MAQRASPNYQVSAGEMAAGKRRSRDDAEIVSRTQIDCAGIERPAGKMELLGDWLYSDRSLDRNDLQRFDAEVIGDSILNCGRPLVPCRFSFAQVSRVFRSIATGLPIV